MSIAEAVTGPCSIEMDEVFPHAPATLWKSITDPRMIARWMMEPTGFEAKVGTHFTYQTKPAGAWDGTIRCEVLEVVPGRRLVYAWRGGDAANVGYGSLLDTVVTWTLTPSEAGTRVQVVHSGFELPRNEIAYQNMGSGWTTVLRRLDGVAGGKDQEGE